MPRRKVLLGFKFSFIKDFSFWNNMRKVKGKMKYVNGNWLKVVKWHGEVITEKHWKSLYKVVKALMVEIKKRRVEKERVRQIPKKYFELWRNFCGYRKTWRGGCNCERTWHDCKDNNCEPTYDVWIKI